MNQIKMGIKSRDRIQTTDRHPATLFRMDHKPLNNRNIGQI